MVLFEYLMGEESSFLNQQPKIYHYCMLVKKGAREVWLVDN